MFSSDDENQGLVLGVVFGVIALVIALVIGIGIYTRNLAAAPKAAPAAAQTVSVVVVQPVATVKVENGVVKFYFAAAKAEIAAGADKALVDVIKGVAEGKKAVISGYTDASGDPAKNEELAKQRAFAVRDALKSLGVAEDKVELKKPEQLTGSGDAAEARRVEVTLQ